MYSTSIFLLLCLIVCIQCQENCDLVQSSCFSIDHPPCHGDHNSTEYVRIGLTPQMINGSQVFQNVAALVCHHVTQSTNQNASFCWEVDIESAVCGQCNCSSVLLAIPGVSPPLLREILLRADTQLALSLTGYTLLTVTIDGDSGLQSDVPIVSWVFVGVGLLLSALVLFKPIWWDRFLLRIHAKCKS